MDENLTQVITELALKRSEALVKKDLAAMNAILAEDFSYTNSSEESFTKAEYIAQFVLAEEMRWASQQLSDIEVWPMGNLVALSCRVHDIADFGDYHLDAEFRSLFLFGKRNAGWQCIAGCTKNS